MLPQPHAPVPAGAETSPAGVMTERALLALLISAIAVGCAFVLYRFASGILWAAILVFATWPVFNQIRQRLRLGRKMAAGLMVLITAVVLVLPLALAASGGADDALRLRRQIESMMDGGMPTSPGWLSGIPVFGPGLAETWNSWAADLGQLAEFLRPYLGIILESGFSLLLGLAGGVLQFLLALFVAYFFWASGDVLAVQLHAVLNRIAGPEADRLIAVTGLVVRGTVYGILGTAVVQGMLTAFGLWVSGVPRPVLLGAVAGFISVLPIGAPAIWIPASIWLIGTGHLGWGIFLAVYGVVLISGSDNVIRPYFISRGAKLPFLVTILGVLGGALAFGLLGIFLGPVLLGIGYILVVEFARGGGSVSGPSQLGPNQSGTAFAEQPEAS